MPVVGCDVVMVDPFVEPEVINVSTGEFTALLELLYTEKATDEVFVATQVAVILTPVDEPPGVRVIDEILGGDIHIA
jgi:hypothetical protein